MAASGTIDSNPVVVNGTLLGYGMAGGSTLSITALDATIADGTGAGGGSVLLFGAQVSNAGSIGTPGGQTVLAAGQSFYPHQGFPPSNLTSTLDIEQTLHPPRWTSKFLSRAEWAARNRD